MAEQYYEGIGRRKASTARVRVMSGTGEFVVNQKSLEDFFTRPGDIETIVGPLETVGRRNTLDISVLVQGGGVTGQTDAVMLGIARALLKLDPRRNARSQVSNEPARPRLTPSARNLWKSSGVRSVRFYCTDRTPHFTLTP